MQDGYLIVPDAPGIGIELVDGIENKYPAIPREYVTRIAEDGSVFDQ